MRISVAAATVACAVAGLVALQVQTADSAPRAYYGVYRAAIVANADPDGRDRVKVKIPSFGAASERWAQVALPIGLTADNAALPEVGDEVLVAFENGDAARPYVIGKLRD